MSSERPQYKCWCFTLMNPDEEELSKLSNIALIDFTVFYSVQILKGEVGLPNETKVVRGMIWNTLGHYSRIDVLKNLISTHAHFEHLEQPKASFYRYIDKFGDVQHN